MNLRRRGNVEIIWNINKGELCFRSDSADLQTDWIHVQRPHRGVSENISKQKHQTLFVGKASLGEDIRQCFHFILTSAFFYCCKETQRKEEVLRKELLAKRSEADLAIYLSHATPVVTEKEVDPFSLT